MGACICLALLAMNLGSLVTLSLLTFSHAIQLESVKAFQMKPGESPAAFAWPEAEALEHKRPVAVCFSGGGSRAYIAAMGYLRALTDLNLTQHIRYLGGSSGGAWAASAYTYFQPGAIVHAVPPGGASRSATSDEQLLGPIIGPKDLDDASLSEMDPACLRNAPVATDLVTDIVLDWIVDGMPFPKALISAVHQVYLAPAGVPAPFVTQPAMFSWLQEDVDDIRKRNPGLRQTPFVVPDPSLERPFLVIGCTLLGPDSLLPLDRFNRSYVIFETNPLWSGMPSASVRTYVSKTSSAPAVQRLVGGMIETYAFGGPSPASDDSRLGPDDSSKLLTGLMLPDEPFTLSHAAAGSSWYIADALASHLGPLSPPVDQIFGLHRPYWSPAMRSGATVGEKDQLFVMGDAGIMENLHLISLLRRESLESFVLFISSSVPLTAKSEWDPLQRPPTQKDIDDTIPNYFGVKVDSAGGVFVYDKNHVFQRQQFNSTVVALQENAARGNGAVATTHLITVDNEYWGIRGGRNVSVTWVLMSRAYAWEDQLSDSLRPLVALPEQDPTALPPLASPYPLFPHYPTSMLQFNAKQANLLGNLAGWLVQQNKDLICTALGGC